MPALGVAGSRNAGDLEGCLRHPAIKAKTRDREIRMTAGNQLLLSIPIEGARCFLGALT
jgi:hypothetical protein